MKSTVQNSATNPDVCSVLLLESCSFYSELNSLYLELESKISSSPQEITDILTKISATVEQVQSIDDRITKLLDRGRSITSENQILLKKRELILQDCLTHNKAITMQASTFKSHLQHEVSSLNTNRHAINGYRTPEVKRRGLINKSF